MNNFNVYTTEFVSWHFSTSWSKLTKCNVKNLLHIVSETALDTLENVHPMRKFSFQWHSKWLCTKKQTVKLDKTSHSARKYTWSTLCSSAQTNKIKHQQMAWH